MTRELHYIFLFVCAQFITNLAASILELAKVNNYGMYSANIIITFSLISLMFYSLINKKIDKIISGCSILFFLIFIVSLLNGDGIDYFNSIISAVASFIISAYCLIYFYWKLVNDDRSTGLTKSAFFWIAVGLFTYYTGSFFIFMSYKFLIVQEPNVIGILWRFHNVLLTIFCIYTIYGITCQNYQKT